MRAASIRAYNARALFLADLRGRLNRYARIALIHFDVNRWMEFRFDLISGLFSAIVASYLVYGSQTNAGEMGFTLSVTIAFASRVLWWIRWYNGMEISGKRNIIYRIS